MYSLKNNNFPNTTQNKNNKYKYRKYKYKYNQLKRIDKNLLVKPEKEINYTEYEPYKPIDWYLFFDLLQISKDIIELTEPNDFIILIGDTPSYLTPFLEKERKLYNFAFSNKPFGCFLPPYSSSILDPNYEKSNKSLADAFTPTVENLHNYFDYLDKETILTRDFMKKNWKNIVLIDSSSGASITGVSIFFNRYAGNIIEEKDGQIICDNITGAQPLQFIRLLVGLDKMTNLDTSDAENFFHENPHVFNYRPNLVIIIGYSIFYFRDEFMFHQAYPRILPFYTRSIWYIPLSGSKIYTKLYKFPFEHLLIYTY